MDQKLLNRAITISAKEEKLQAGKPVIKIKDEKGLTYTVYKTKQDGSTSVAWEQLSELDLGDTVQIGYVEDMKDSPEYGTVTYRTIRSFNKDIGNGMMNAAQQSASKESSRYEANRGQYSEARDAFGKRLALHGMVNGLLAGGGNPAQVMNALPDLLKLEDAIDKALSEPKATEAEDMDVGGIPF